MKIKIQGFLGTNHSWSLVQQNIARSMSKMGHDVHLFSTNGYEHFPSDLEKLVKQDMDRFYDCQISYTAMINFSKYLANGDKNRFGIWNYESTVLPQGFAKNYKYTDLFLPSSDFSRQIFKENGVPDDIMRVVPHGIDIDAFKTDLCFKLKTKKKYKILANIAQPHVRKNLNGLFEAFGRAFNKKDDVCLVAKVAIKKQKEHKFEVSFEDIYNNFKKKYPNHAEVEIVNQFIPNIFELYNSCDIVFSMTHAECFWLPGLEAMAAGKVTIAPNWGGQLEYMNEENSLLINGKEGPALRDMQYWSVSPYAKTFYPNPDHAAELLKYSINNYNDVYNKLKPGMEQTSNKLTWDNVAKQIIELCK